MITLVTCWVTVSPLSPDGITTQVWYLKGANGLTVTQQVTNVIMMA